MVAPPGSSDRSARPWRILIVDDHPIVRMGLASLISAEADLEVCGQAADYGEALRAIAQVRPDLAIIDLSLRDSSGLELLKEVTRQNVQAMVVSMHDEPTWAERALAAGARGYLHKSEAGRNVVDAIRKVRAGRLYVSESISELLLERRVSAGPAEKAKGEGIAALTDRELEVFARIGKGLTTRQIAAELHLSPKTVQTYRARIKQKLRIKRGPQLVQRAVEWVLQNG